MARCAPGPRPRASTQGLSSERRSPASGIPPPFLREALRSAAEDAGAAWSPRFSVEKRGFPLWNSPARPGTPGERTTRNAAEPSDFGPRVSIHRFAQPEKIVTFLGGEARGYDTAVAFSRDGRRLYTGNEDGRVRVWDTATWKQVPELGWEAHRGTVTALAVSHDRTLIATSGDDTLRLFPIDPEPGESRRRESFSLYLDQPANWIHFARGEDGRDRALLHSTPGGTLDIWETDLDQR